MSNIPSTDTGENGALSSLNENIVNLQSFFLPGVLETEIASFVDFYSRQRYHEILCNLPPADVYFGRAKAVLNRRSEIKKKTLQQSYLQNLQVAVG